MAVIKGIEIELGGTVYIVPPLSLGAVERFEDRLAGFTGQVDKAGIGLVLDVAEAALKRNYPDITRAALADIVDLGNFQELFEAVMDVSGMKRKAAASGEAPGVVTAP